MFLYLKLQGNFKKSCMCKNKLGRSENQGLLKGQLSGVWLKLKLELWACKICLSLQKTWGGEEKLPLLETMANFNSISKNKLICAIIHEQIQHFSRMSWRDFFSRVLFCNLPFTLQFAVVFSGKIRLNRFYADIKALLPWLLFVNFFVV